MDAEWFYQYLMWAAVIAVAVLLVIMILLGITIIHNLLIGPPETENEPPKKIGF